MCDGNDCESCMFADISPMSKLDTICLDKNNKNYRKIVPTLQKKSVLKRVKVFCCVNHYDARNDNINLFKMEELSSWI